MAPTSPSRSSSAGATTRTSSTSAPPRVPRRLDRPLLRTRSGDRARRRARQSCRCRQGHAARPLPGHRRGRSGRDCRRSKRDPRDLHSALGIQGRGRGPGRRRLVRTTRSGAARHELISVPHRGWIVVQCQRPACRDDCGRAERRAHNTTPRQPEGGATRLPAGPGVARSGHRRARSKDRAPRARERGKSRTARPERERGVDRPGREPLVTQRLRRPGREDISGNRPPRKPIAYRAPGSGGAPAATNGCERHHPSERRWAGRVLAAARVLNRGSGLGGAAPSRA